MTYPTDTYRALCLAREQQALQSYRDGCDPEAPWRAIRQESLSVAEDAALVTAALRSMTAPTLQLVEGGTAPTLLSRLCAYVGPGCVRLTKLLVAVVLVVGTLLEWLGVVRWLR